MDDEPTTADIVREATKAFGQLGAQFRDAFAEQIEAAQYRIDKEVARQLAKYPELAVELKRGVRKTRRAVDRFLGDWGLK